MAGAVLLALLSILLRGRSRAAVVWLALWVLAVPSGEYGDYAYRLMVFSVGLFTTVRFGLFASILHFLPYHLLSSMAFQFDASSPYAGISSLYIGTVVALALYGFHTALGGGPVFAGVLKEESV